MSESPSGHRRLFEQLEAQVPKEVVRLDDVGLYLDAIRDAIEERKTVVILGGTGAGKSTYARGVIAGHGAGIIASPYHEIAAEHVRALGSETAVHRQGVVRQCLVPEITKPLQAIGISISRVVCPTCPKREGCPARERREAPVVATVHQLVIDQQRSSQPLILDETPQLFDETVLTPDALAEAEVLISRELGESERVYDRSYLLGLRRWSAILRQIIESRAATPTEVLRLHGWGEYGALTATALYVLEVDGHRTDDRLAGVVPGLPLVEDERLRSRVSKGAAQFGRLRRLAKHVADGGRLYRDGDADLIRTAHQIGRHCGVGIIAVHPSDVARHLCDRNARSVPCAILDATAPVAEIAALLEKPATVVEFAVPDAGVVERTVRYWTNGTRSSITTPRAVEEASVLLSEVGEELRARGAVRTLLVVHRAADRGRAGYYKWAADNYPEPWRQHFGADLTVDYFGSERLRGSNRYQTYDSIVTLGDPWPPIDQGERLATELSIRTGRTVDPWALMRGRVAATLAQVFGRLRAVRRREPAWMIHIGAVAPADWHTRNTTVITRPRGRPPGSRDGKELIERLVSMGMPRAEIARQLGTTTMSISRWVRGETGPSEQQVEHLLALLERV